MERTMMDELEKWKSASARKPLILKGARQVGKTWLLKTFGERFYDDVAYFNFDTTPGLRQFFEHTKEPTQILKNLQLVRGTAIHPEKTLIIFDEIQDSPDAVGALKYFCETAPQYHIAAAGSLLGVALAKPAAFPVGKVHFKELLPMTFSEFLVADGGRGLADFIDALKMIELIPDIFMHQLVDQLRIYMSTGGMPEVVKSWAKTHDMTAVDAVLSDIIEAYKRDFSKHPSSSMFPKISLVWQSLPSQLARENKKFFYQTVKAGARAREYEDALQWLLDAHLIRKVNRVKTPRLPVTAYDDLSAFKIYMGDVGVLRRHAGLPPDAFVDTSRILAEFKGAFAENIILQSLLPQLEVTPRYWTQTNPPHEVDFIVQVDNEIIPIEVKSGENLRSQSLTKYNDLFSPPLRVRFSMDNLILDGNVLNIPIPLADRTLQLMRLALATLRSQKAR